MRRKPQAEEIQTEFQLDPYKLDGLPGLGPVRQKRLEEEGITTLFDLAVMNPTAIQQILQCEMAIVDKVYKTAKAFLESSNLVWKSNMTALELLEKRKTLRRLKTGCSGLDLILDGGIEQRSITEFYGENGSGKSQLGHKLAIVAQLSVLEGGLREEGESAPVIIIIDTENKYSPERMIKILSAMGLIEDIPSDLKKKMLNGLDENDKVRFDEFRANQVKQAEKFLTNIHIIQPKNAAEQLFAIKKIRSWISSKLPVKLLIIDSTVALFRSEMSERGTSWRKKDMMNEMFGLLKGIAETFNICVVSMNQIYNSPDEQYGDPDIPYGGNILGHALGYRIKFSRTNATVRISADQRAPKHVALVKKSPLRGNDAIQFYIDDTGLVDAA